MYTDAVLFVMNRNWKWPSCPSVGEQFNKLVYVYSGTLVNNEKELTADSSYNMDESQNIYLESSQQCGSFYISLENPIPPILTAEQRLAGWGAAGEQRSQEEVGGNLGDDEYVHHGDGFTSIYV